MTLFEVGEVLEQLFDGFDVKAVCQVFEVVVDVSNRACLKRRHVYEAVWPSGRVAEINFGRCLPMSTTLAAAARSKPS